MPVSALNSQVVYDALKANGIRLLSVFPETWLVHLVSLAEEDPEILRNAPYTTPVRRLDEAAAAKRPVVRQRLD